MKWPCWVHALPKEFDSLSATPRTRFLIPGLHQENRAPHVRLCLQVIVDSRRKLPMCHEAFSTQQAAFKGGALWQFHQFLSTGSQFSPSSLPEACSVCLVQSIIIGTEPDDRLAGTDFEPVLRKGERPNSLWKVFSFFFFSLRFYPPRFDPLNVRRHQQNLASRAWLVNFFFFFRKCSIAPSTGKKNPLSHLFLSSSPTLYTVWLLVHGKPEVSCLHLSLHKNS